MSKVPLKLRKAENFIESGKAALVDETSIFMYYDVDDDIVIYNKLLERFSCTCYHCTFNAGEDKDCSRKLAVRLLWRKKSS
jgi:hypothetical protein